MKKVGFISLGCPKNLVDSEVMMGQLKQAGYQITADAGDADTVVVNTCGFIDSAKQESIDAILEAARCARVSSGNLAASWYNANRKRRCKAWLRNQVLHWWW